MAHRRRLARLISIRRINRHLGLQDRLLGIQDRHLATAYKIVSFRERIYQGAVPHKNLRSHVERCGFGSTRTRSDCNVTERAISDGTRFLLLLLVSLDLHYR